MTIKNAALAISLSATVALSACASVERFPPLTLAETNKARVLGIPNARFMITQLPELTAEFSLAVQREIDARHAAGLEGPLPPAALLAISGGGDDGAFGAGLLTGWTVHGDRPSFKGVTGVSTGALTAPFAFLGPEYDAQLRQVFTTLSAHDIFTSRGFLAAITDDAMNDTTPLFKTVERLLDDRMLGRIAEEYMKGRLLLIMTTDLDVGLPCVWNIGAIAASGKPGARALITKILLASAAVPAAFPPQLIDIDVDGVHHQEMHVDGGVFAQAFLYPPSIDLQANARSNAATSSRQRDAYIIRNGRLFSDPANVDRATLPIAGRAVSLMIGASGLNDMFRIYMTTSRDHVGYHLAYIPREFTEPYKGPFDQTYMTKLFQFGYEQGRAGNEWHDKPPGWTE
jgi:hypothetical protein